MKDEEKKKKSTFQVSPRLLALKDAAQYLGRSVWGMRSLAWDGKIPVIQDGKKIYFDVKDLDKYVEGNKRTYF